MNKINDLRHFWDMRHFGTFWNVSFIKLKNLINTMTYYILGQSVRHFLGQVFFGTRHDITLKSNVFCPICPSPNVLSKIE